MRTGEIWAKLRARVEERVHVNNMVYGVASLDL